MEYFWKLCIYGVIMMFSPGPNNIMLASSGATFGFRRTIPHMIGIVAGFQCLVIGSGLGIGGLLAASPKLSLAVKCLGALYMMYLAYRIATSRVTGLDAKGERRAKPLSFLQAALFQPMNPKAWISALSGLSLYIPESVGILERTATGAAAFLSTSILSTLLWAALGQSIKQFFNTPSKLRIFNQATAAILIAMIALLFL